MQLCSSHRLRVLGAGLLLVATATLAQPARAEPGAFLPQRVRFSVSQHTFLNTVQFWMSGRDGLVAVGERPRTAGLFGVTYQFFAPDDHLVARGQVSTFRLGQLFRQDYASVTVKDVDDNVLGLLEGKRPGIAASESLTYDIYDGEQNLVLKVVADLSRRSFALLAPNRQPGLLGKIDLIPDPKEFRDLRVTLFDARQVPLALVEALTVYLSDHQKELRLGEVPETD